jgi:hypothetical protein
MDTILYFVGAGLTKSLALPAHPIPAMFDFISTVSEYLSDDVVLTTLAELENAEPYPYAWESPVCRTLARSLVDPNEQRAPDLRSQFGQALRDRPSESIEDLLDQTDGDSSNVSSQTADLRFQYAVGRVFALIKWNVDWDPLDSFLRRQLQSRASAHAFVSFNYDLVLDRAIERCEGGRLDLSSIYGFHPVGAIVSDPSQKGSLTPQISAFPGQTPANNSVSLLKPHGSLNWWVRVFQPDTSPDQVWHDTTVVVPVTAAGGLRYVMSTDTHPRVHFSGEMPFRVDPVILTPRSAKTPKREFLVKVREQEEQAISSADEVYVLGWSIPRTDTDQECLIRNAISKRTTAFRRVTVVNLRADVEYFKRVKDIFGAADQALEICNSGFREFIESRNFSA